MVTLKKLLAKKLTKKELSLLRASFDSIGTIAILEIPRQLEKKEKTIAAAIMQQNTAVKTVLKKVGKHSGMYRVQKTKVLLGDKTKETTHKENGLVMKLNVEKCYFSPRLSTERIRIAKMVKQGERVLVMFSGVGPYPIVLAKYSSAKQIVAIEKNPVAAKYAIENVRLNNISEDKILLYKGDVKTVVSRLKAKFDRIVMPLPKSAERFLHLAFKVLKKNGFIHIYQFADESQEQSVAQKVAEQCQKQGACCTVVGITRTGQSGPRKYRIRVDLQC